MTKEETLDKIEDLRTKKSKLEKQTRKIKADLDKLETEAVQKGFGMWVFSREKKIVPNLKWWEDNYPRSWRKYVEIRSYNKFEPLEHFSHPTK
jgi:hypothetical protein